MTNDDAITIAVNMEDGRKIRPYRTGRDFSVLPGGKLNVRYTASTRSSIREDDADARAAVAPLSEFLASDSPHIHRATLQSGRGPFSNNVLHDRPGFKEDEGRRRLLCRLRCYQRIAGT